MYCFLVCLFYGATSGTLSLIMKNLLSGYQWQGYFLILAAQMGLQLGLCILTRDVLGNPFGVPAYDRPTHMKSLKMGVCNVGNIAVGLVALRMVNVPMFLCIRRLVAPCILLYELVALGKVSSAPVNGAVGTILLGTLVAGWETLTSDLVGYAMTFLNNVLSAAVRARAARAGALQPRLSPPHPLCSPSRRAACS